MREFLNKEENKNVVFNFWQNHTPAIAAKVRTGELDIGFGGYLKKEDMEFFPLKMCIRDRWLYRSELFQQDF